MIRANEAKNKTDAVIARKEKDALPWRRLENEIKKAISRGEYNLHFEERIDSKFVENRKEIKNRLEDLGYKVEYHRFIYDSCYRPYIYLNCYDISWENN